MKITLFLLFAFLISCSSKSIKRVDKNPSGGTLFYTGFSKTKEKDFVSLIKKQIHCKESYEDVSTTSFIVNTSGEGEFKYNCLKYSDHCQKGHGQSCFVRGIQLLSKKNSEAPNYLFRSCQLKYAKGCYYSSIISKDFETRKKLLNNACLMGYNRACRDSVELVDNSSITSKLSYLETFALEENAELTLSGIAYKIIRPGSLKRPTPSSKVKVHYRGKLTNGKVFDSTYDSNSPITFELANVIPGWIEGLQLIGAGGKIHLVIPSELAYGTRGAMPHIPPNSDLDFEIELIEVL